jgi:hypothetical protein
MPYNLWGKKVHVFIWCPLCQTASTWENQLLHLIWCPHCQTFKKKQLDLDHFDFHEDSIRRVLREYFLN